MHRRRPLYVDEQASRKSATADVVADPGLVRGAYDNRTRRRKDKETVSPSPCLIVSFSKKPKGSPFV